MVEKLVEGQEEWTLITSKGEVKTTEYVVHDLKPDINYFFRVSAINCAGRGEPLEMTEPVQAKDILGKILTNTFLCMFCFPLISLCDHCYFLFHRGGSD